MRFKFIPSDWQPSDKLLQWCRDKGLSNTQIEEQLERIRDHEYKRAMSRPDACFRNWIRNAIKWGDVVCTAPREYRGIKEVSEEQRKADEAKAWAEMNRLRGVK